MTIQITTSANIYANSLLETGLNNDAVIKDLSTIGKILKSSSDLQSVMINPAIPSDKKFDILQEVFKNQINDKMINFLKILIDKNKFTELEQIKQAYILAADEADNIQRVEIISAIELQENQKQRLVNKLSDKYKKNIAASWSVDEDIIGGLIIKTKDEVTDNSIKNKLERLSKIRG